MSQNLKFGFNPLSESSKDEREKRTQRSKKKSFSFELCDREKVYQLCERLELVKKRKRRRISQEKQRRVYICVIDSLVTRMGKERRQLEIRKTTNVQWKKKKKLNESLERA